MPIFQNPIPLSLYIHIPWCVRKCPYCDFNSHAAKNDLPEARYVSALLEELESLLFWVQGRSLHSIFFGGGTPSLFSGKAIKTILDGVKQRIPFDKDIEITLEANPGKIDQAHFYDFLHAGINRLSLGIQSFQNEKLKQLGRIHDTFEAQKAIQMIKDAGFTHFNLDLMYGLPDQSIEDALIDLDTALSFKPAHLSWYQLTLEPNTLFYQKPPPLPTDETIWSIQKSGQALLKKTQFDQYEISAYAFSNQRSKHNLNYWQFGDYLGIGAGAHSKITDKIEDRIIRFSQVKHPNDYLDPKKRTRSFKTLTQEDLIFEFMLNALRLTMGVPIALFSERTKLPLDKIAATLQQARKRGLLIHDENHLAATPLGLRFLNDLTALFLA